ncbi:hypothetical protein TcYC6_0065970 [Trypanosoma cruzi]|nr:hypothetical protein TcYC6_0065970 [Trypanosoma cruzi]
MADRLRLSLSLYFSKHMDRGDWRSVLRALHGCAETGTLLHSLPHDTIFPFLVANGQWESVLRLSSQLIAVEESHSNNKTKTKKGNKGTAVSLAQEEGLYNTLLRATLAQEAVSSMGSWQAAAAIVQRAARRRVRLETPVIRDVLRTVENWQHELANGSNSSGTLSGKEESPGCSDALLLTRDMLAADLHLRGKSPPIPKSTPACRPPRVLQSDLVQAIHDTVFQGSFTKDRNDPTHWEKLREQMHASFTSSWEDAVYTVLHVCVPRTDSIRKVEEGETVDTVLQATIDYITVRPDAAEKILHWTQQRMFNGAIITLPHSSLLGIEQHDNVVGGGGGDGDSRSDGSDNGTSLAWWRREVEKQPALELPKWEMVKALAMAELEQRERQWAMVEGGLCCWKEESREKRTHTSTLTRLCIAVQLICMRDDALEQKEIPVHWDDMKQKEMECLARKLLLHGSVVMVTATGVDDFPFSLLSDTVQTLMTVYIRLCCVRDHRRRMLLNHTGGSHGGQPQTPKEYVGGTFDKKGNANNNANEIYSLSSKSALASGRDVFWENVLFPYTLAGWQRSPIAASWQELLRRVFCDTSLLKMWFFDDGLSHGRNATIDERLMPSAEKKEENTAGGGGVGHSRGRRRRRFGGSGVMRSSSFFCEEALKQLQELVYFLSRRFPPLDNYRAIFPLHYEKRDEEYQRGSQFRVSDNACMNTDNDVRRIPALFNLLARQEEVDEIGRGLLQACVKDNLSVSDASNVWRTFVFSIAPRHVVPLLRCMMDVASAQTCEGPWRSCRVALVVVMHESDVSSTEEKVNYTARLFHSIEPRTTSWRAALALCVAAASKIGEQLHDGKTDGSLSHILDALLVSAAPPRWREALQVVELMHHVVPNTGEIRGKDDGCMNGALPNRTPLSESERIDLYEFIAPLKQRRHWMSAIELFTTYEARQLSGHDCACFAFAVKHGPLSFARRVLISLRGKEKSREVAQAALVASERHVKQAVRALQKKRQRQRQLHQGEQHDDDGSVEHERAFMLHEANQVARLALAAWPTPISNDEDFALIWKCVKGVCAGNVNAAKLLLRQSALYDTDQARNEADALMQTVRLCSTAQDAASAIAAYKKFRERFIGMVLPEETMLQLLSLCVASVVDAVEDVTTSDGITILCTVLKDTLLMHDVSIRYESKPTGTPRNCMLHACVVLFRLSAPADERAVVGIPKFRCDATPVMQRHAQRLLHVLTKHLVGTDARILRNLPDFIGVLRALPPLCLNAAVSPMSQTLPEASGVNPIAMLNHHVQKLEKKLGPVVPVDCLFWLGILQSEKVTLGTSAFPSSLSCPSVREEGDGEAVQGEVRDVPRWNPETFVMSNDVMNTREATAQLDRIILHAIERAAPHDAEKKLSSSLRCLLLPCIIEALAFLLHHCWHAQPPLTVILAAAAYALHSLDATPEWVLGENAMEILAAFQTIFFSFHVCHTVAELAVLAHPAHRLSSAVDTVLSRTAYEEVRYVHDFILLVSAWMQRRLHAAESEERRMLDEPHAHFMIRLVGNLAGTCASWPESSLRKESLRQLRLLCEMMERCVNAGKTAPLSSTALLVLRVMSTILRNGPMDNDAVEAHFVGATAVSKVHTSSDVNMESPPAGNAALSDLFLAITLLHIVRYGARSSIRLVRAFLPALQLEEGLQTVLSDDEGFVGGLVAMQSARLNATAAVRRAFSMSLSAATRFITRLVEFPPILSVDALTAQWLRSEEQLVEFAVFAALAACRDGEASDENDIVGAMDAVGTLVPHRWDLPYAIAFECPLTATQKTTSMDLTLRSRLAFVLQCCGPWPGGIVLRLLLQASWPAVSGGKNDGILSNYNEILDVMANLSVDKRFRTISIAPLLQREASLPLMQCVVLCHHQASTAACIILGNATPQEQEPQRQQKRRWDVWKAFFTSDGAVQFIAIAYMTASLSETRSTLQERQQLRQLLADMTSWLSSSLSSSSFFSWPWRSLCLEARQLLLWSRVTLTVPQWASVKEKMHETMTEEKRMIAAAMSLVTSPHVVSSTTFYSVNRERAPTFLSSSADATAAKTSFVMCFQCALFNTAWVAEMCAKQFAFKSSFIYSRLCRALRVLPDVCVMRVGENDVDDDVVGMIAAGSLFATPCGFSSLQYVRAAIDMVSDVTRSGSEKSFLLSIACSQSMQDALELLEKRLSQRPNTPLCVQSLLAAWNTLLIRSVEVDKQKGKRMQPMGHSVEAHAESSGKEYNNAKNEETSLHHCLAAAFLALAVTTRIENCEASISMKSPQPAEGEGKLRQRLCGEILAYGAYVGEFLCSSASINPSELRFQQASAEIAARAISLLPKEQTLASDFDAHVKLATELVGQYMRGDGMPWISLWPPLSLEMWRSREYIKCLHEPTPALVPLCQLRHPVAVSWMMHQIVTDASPFGSSTRPLIALFNTLRVYVTTGTALFSPSRVKNLEKGKQPANEGKDDGVMVPVVRGAGAGMVIDQFLCITLQEWQKSGHHDKAEVRDRDVIRHVVDAVFPPVQIGESSSATPLSFLSGYTPLTTDGLQSLLRLVVLRDGFDKRRTASVNHVEKLLQMEQRREMARRIAANDAGLPLTRVHIGLPRGVQDVKAQLLFYLRALAATLAFLNPMAWHNERQASLDVAYTALMDFLHLCSASYDDDVDIMSRQLKVELEGIFGHGVVRVICAATSQQDGIVTLRQLINFFTGNWHHQQTKKKRQEKASDLHRRLRNLLSAHRHGGGVSDVLLLKGDDLLSAPPMPLFTQTTSMVQEALWSTAVLPSHELILELLDAAVTTAAADSANPPMEALHAARHGLKLFTTIAPYMVVPTLMLEKVLMLLLVLLRQKFTAAAVSTEVDETKKEEKALCESTFYLVLCRFQYVQLNTPTAVALLCELYAVLATMNATSDTQKDAGDVHAIKTIHYPLPWSSNKATQLPQEEWLLWRCALEANQVSWAPLQTALSSLKDESLRLLQRGCLAFLMQGHRRSHYDPPFLRLGRMLDTLIPHESGVLDESATPGIHGGGGFTVQLLRMMEADSTRAKMSVVPWRRALKFLPDPHEGSKEMVTDTKRFRFYVALMSQLLTAASKKNDSVRQIWQHALSIIVPQLISAKEQKGLDTELMHHGTACALRALHIVQPPHAWSLALHLTLRLPIAAFPSLSWWPSPEAVLFHTLKYLVEVCDVTEIPVKSLVFYMQVVAKRQSAAAAPELLTGRVNRSKVVEAFTDRLQRHPHLRWVDALALLESLCVLEKALVQKNSKEINSGSSRNNNMEENEVQWVFNQAKCKFTTAVIERLYKKQSYESLLRFVEAAQQHYRVSGREVLEWVNHAASVVVAPSRSGGLSELLLLLNGTLVGKTLDDILREQSAGVLRERVSLMRDLLLNGHYVDAAALVRQTPTLLRTREFYDACARLMKYAHHRTVVLFYDAYIHPEDELESGAKNLEENCSEGNNCALTKLLEEEVYHTEEASLLRHVPNGLLEQGMIAFETAANSTKGISFSARRTGIWIAATWIRRVTALMQSQDSLVATLRWVHRDIVGGHAGKPGDEIQILADAVRDMLHAKVTHDTSQFNNNNNDDDDDGTNTKESLINILQRERELACLFVKIFSGTFSGVASELCEFLLQREQHLMRDSGVERKAVECDNKDMEWWSFLRCTASYNAAIEEGYKYCRTLMDTTVNNGSNGHHPIVEWRDRSLFRIGTESHAWVLALAAYATSRSYVGHTYISGAHIARLVKLITASGSLRVVIPAARNVFFHLNLSNPKSGVASPFLNAMLLLCQSICTMKRHTLHRLQNAAEMDSGEVQAVLGELDEINQFIGDGLALLLQQHQEKRQSTVQDTVLDGRMDLVCSMIRSLTVTPGPSVTPAAALEAWRSLVQQIITALPSAQRCSNVLDACMDTVRDSFEELSLLRKYPTPALTSLENACNGLWCSALGLITADESLRRHLFAHTNTQQLRAMTQLETFLCCASLVADGGVAAMRSICDVAVRAQTVPLSEDAKALVKMACIHGKGAAWRSEYEAITGFAPTTVQRQRTLSPAEEAMEQVRCLHALEAVEDWAQALRLSQAKREVGVRLQHLHYHRMLHLLGKYNMDNTGAVAFNTAMGDAVMGLYFARLQDGCLPNTYSIEQSLRLFSVPTVSPLLALQYAQALTLLPPLSNRRHRKTESRGDGSHATHASSVSHAPDDMGFAVSILMLRLVTDAALRLPDAVRRHRLTKSEGVEGLQMFAAFIRWVSEFSRVPCCDGDVMEAIALLLCTVPKQLLSELTTTKKNLPHCDAGDVRRLLFRAFVAPCGDGMPVVDAHTSSASMKLNRFVSRVSKHQNNGNDDDDNDGGEIPTPATLCALRGNAEAALRFVEKQASLHHVMHLSNALLCRMCAAVTAGTSPTAKSLQSLSHIMQNTKLISPPLRYMLTLIVAEQSTLWEIYHTGGSDPKKMTMISSPRHAAANEEVPTSVVLRSVSRTYKLVRQHFTPPDAIMLHGLLLPKHLAAAETKDDHKIAHEEEEDEEDDDGAIRSQEKEEEENEEGASDSVAQNVAWEQALKLFDIFVRNAQPNADLSVPFEALIEIFCRGGQWNTASRHVSLAGTPSTCTLHTSQPARSREVADDAFKKNDASHFFSRHVVVDCFLLKRLLDAMEAARQRHYRHGEQSPSEGVQHGCGPPGFWRLTLHILQQQQQMFLLSPVK